ncbi:hypothetical protein [Rhizobium leguminosarum]|uniref:Uncharacterized protein n=1 Tax=Rhizobium leguminosarum TaxID=384 RepID=A0A6P0BBP3_RHILE|nr:hypothetical protein [Rhizobium leguminosarum]MBY5440664.1 hypothetical protein [Rhizobium leguminosarum]NEI36334.1 hypothetical protein [Rhizobium leguminosarum]NEI42601.1 hypothetical protein [Rhizobium leguminosarum]
MPDLENSLIIEIWKLKATAKSRFAILAVLGFVFAFMAGVTYFGGTQLLDRYNPETTASIEK